MAQQSHIYFYDADIKYKFNNDLNSVMRSIPEFSFVYISDALFDNNQSFLRVFELLTSKNQDFYSIVKFCEKNEKKLFSLEIERKIGDEYYGYHIFMSTEVNLIDNFVIGRMPLIGHLEVEWVINYRNQGKSTIKELFDLVDKFKTDKNREDCIKIKTSNMSKNYYYGYNQCRDLFFIYHLRKYCGDISDYKAANFLIETENDLFTIVKDFHETYIKSYNQTRRKPKKATVWKLLTNIHHGFKFIQRNPNIFADLKFDTNIIQDWYVKTRIKDITIKSDENFTLNNYGKEYTIVLVGESGVGKSTTICSIANYLHHRNYNSAKTAADNEQMIICMPMKFSVAQDGRNNYVQYLLTDEDNQNERFDNVGESATRDPTLYEFHYNLKKFKIIDTPGLIDTRHKQQDDINLQKIKDMICQQSSIHAICIVMKANENKIRVEMQYAIFRLLSLFPKNALRNVFTLFTFADENANSSYQIIQRFSEDYKRIHGETFQVNEDSSCYVNSETFKYLLARQQRIPYPNIMEARLAGLWNFSANQIIRFLDFIRNDVEPITTHEIENFNDYYDNARELIQQYNEHPQYQRDIQTFVNYINGISLKEKLRIDNVPNGSVTYAEFENSVERLLEARLIPE